MKRLYRSEDDKRIAGVCAGLGEYFNIDPNFVRVIFLTMALLWGAGVALYIFFWICIPKKGEPK